MINDTVVSVLSRDFATSGEGTLRAAPDFSNLTATPGRDSGYIEWMVTLPRAGKWRVRALMTSDKACPCALQINGEAQPDPILGEVTGSLGAGDLTWFAYGPFDFDAGDNLVRVTFSAGQPLLKELAFVEVGPSDVLVFDGTTTHVEVGDPFEDDSAFTVSLWARTSALDDGSTHGLIGKQGDPPGKPALWLGAEKGALHYESFSPSGEGFSGSIDGFFAKDRWIHVSWVKRGDRYEFYRDGRLLAERPAPARIYSRRSSYWIGRRLGCWTGHIAHVRVWAMARSAEEVRADMHRALDVASIGLVSFWPMDDGAGTAARDKVGRAAHGAITAGTWAKSVIPFADETGSANKNVPVWRQAGGSITDLSAGRHADGRLIVLMRGKDGALSALSQEAPSSDKWGSPVNLAGGFKGRPAVASQGDGRVFCAMIGMDDQLTYRQQTAPASADWVNYQHNTGCALSNVRAIANADGRISLLGRGKDDQLWHIHQTDPNGDEWSSWTCLGGALGGSLAVIRTGTNRLEVFARGTEGDLWHTWQDAPGSIAFRPWHPLGGDVSGTPAVGRNEDGRFQVFARGADEALWTLAQSTPNGLWGRWESLGKGGTGGVAEPAAVADAEGRLVVLVRAKDGSLWSRRQSTPGGTFEDWTRIGGDVGSFAVMAGADGRLEVMAVGSDGQLHLLQESAPGSGLV